MMCDDYKWWSTLLLHPRGSHQGTSWSAAWGFHERCTWKGKKSHVMGKKHYKTCKLLGCDLGDPLNFEASEYYKDVHPPYSTHGQKHKTYLTYLFLFWIYLKIATILKGPPPSFSLWSQARSSSPEGERGPWVKVNRGKGAHQSGRNRGPTRRTAPCKYFCLNFFFHL